MHIQRDGDLITASASVWGTGSSVLAVDPSSEITIDLSDSANNLSVFQGEQYYGYGTMSQLGATFLNITFTTPNMETDPTYIYDLVNNTVYVKNTEGGGYQLVSGALARTVIGFPKRVKNLETQKEFMINSATDHSEL